MMQLAEIHLYPVKSLRGCAVSTAALDPLGLVGDRRFLVVDAEGRFLTQRTLPRMALIATALDATHLTLTTPAADSVRVPRAATESAPLRSVSVWKSAGLLAEDCGDPAAELLADFLGTHCRLVRIGGKFQRPILDPSARAGDCVSFADGYPLLGISTASLADLNARLGVPLPMDRFRPNLVFSGCAAFAEDTWPRFRVGAITFRAGGPCVRCLVTTTDQRTGERGREPLRTLATYRREPANGAGVIFGQNLIHETKTGTLRIGDALTPL